MIALLFLFILFILLQNASQNQGVEISLLEYEEGWRFHRFSETIRDDGGSFS